MTTYQTQAVLGHNWWETREPQDDRVLLQKFQQYDRNRDGVLEKNEFRSLLKDLFASQITNQFLEDAIEETVWRVPNADYSSAKHAIASINDTLRVETQTTPAAKPLNAQGQAQHPYPYPSTTTSTQFNPFNLPPPPVSTIPPPTVDLSKLPPPPPLRSSGEVPLAIPPPPRTNSAGVGVLKRPAMPASVKPAPPVSTTAKPAPQPSSLPAKLPAKSAPFIPPTQEMLQEKIGPQPVRVLPVGQTKPGLNSAANASAEESRAFVEYINTSVALQQDPDVKGILPIKSNSSDIYTIVSDGWLLCKLLNAIQPEIIPSTQIKLKPKNAFEKIENHSLAIQAARKLGCKTVNIGPEDLLQGKPRLVLGLLWQIIKRDVLSKVSLAQHPEIYKLARNSTSLKEISESSPEEVLIKWANHHLQNATKGAKQITNFSQDVKDGTTYTLLMNQVAPQVCNTDALREADIGRRAQMVVENAKKLNCDRFITPADIVNGNDKLNLAFMADLFNKHSGLELPTLEEMEKLKKQNASMSKILDEAEARLRQILADGKLAHELQQEEILLYRQRKLKEQEQLAEEEAMLRAQVQQEELMLMQQQRMKDMKLEEQESFAREEQKKEELKSGKRLSSSTQSFGSTSRSTSSNSLSKSASTNYYSAASTSSSSAFRQPPAPIPASTYSTTTPSTTFPSTASYYPSNSSTVPLSTTTYGPPPTTATYGPPPSYPSTGPATVPTSTPYPTYVPPPAVAASYAYSSSGYSATNSAPNPYNVTPSYGAQTIAPNPYNTTTYPPTPNYPVGDQPYLTTTQTVYNEPPPVASYADPDPENVTSRRRGMFERFGKKIDKAFH